MKTVRRLLYGDIVASVGFTALAFLSLFFFIDFVDELGDVGKQGYQLWHAAIACLLAVPGHFYELFPIAVLIGTIYSMARMAQSSEYTILRTGGLGPGRALQLLATLGVVFSALTWVVGDYFGPWGERQAVQLRADRSGGLQFGRTGAWLKDRRDTPQGERTYSINVASADSRGVLTGVRIFEFDADSRLLERVSAKTARVGDDGVWRLQDVLRTEWTPGGDAAPPEPDTPAVPDAAPATGQDAKAAMAEAAQAAAAVPPVREQWLARHDWHSTLDADVVAAAVLPIATMSTIDLFRYARHLEDNEQAGQRYEIQFWKKALYPFACLVMVALALPFAYLQSRSGGISFKVFGGIMLGISFVLMNNVAGHLGLLRDWTPWLVAAVPSLLYLLLSLAAFSWLVRYR